MKRLALCLLALLVPAAVFAQNPDGDANVNVLITVPSYTGCADPNYDFIDAGFCEDLVSDPIPGGAFVWVVYSHQGGWADGIAGAQFGIDYSGVDVQSWALCTGGAEIPEAGWPAAGTGNAATWAGGCYNPAAGNARVGFFTVGDGSSGTMGVIPDPRINDTQFTNCTTDLFSICAANLGSADLAGGTLPLCTNECGGTPVEETSWGSIKSMFN